ncbi:MAG: Spo0B domain-containing protein [Bacillota bacterium]|jgi:hypothetical protein
MPAGFAGTLLHYGLFLYHFILEIGVTLALALTLNGYDIKQNHRRIMIFAVIYGAAAVVFFHFPQWLRSILVVIVPFTAVRLFFGFTTGKAVLTFFIYFLSQAIIDHPSTIVLFHFFEVSPSEFLTSPLIRLLYPLPYIPLAVFTYVSYRRGWRIFKEPIRLKTSTTIFLLPIIQIIFISIVINEFFFGLRFDQPLQTIEALFFSVLFVSMALSLFFLWRIYRLAEQEAAVAAQEKLALELRQQTDAVRAQRHDFVNHVQVMLALLKEGRKEELVRYAAGIKRNL